jgi:4-methyl-5(b-hydroxyethyl)-thiazole monophosphate biosynthesis
MAKVLVPLADGFEEIEAITVVDLLRRAGIDVCTAGLTARSVTGSHDIRVEADTTLDAVAGTAYDMIVLPGGMPGAQRLREDARVRCLVAEQSRQGKYTAAICAAPGVLAAAGVLDGRSATSFPGFLDPATTPGLSLSEAPVVVDGLVVTSRSAGTALDFALTLIELLEGRKLRDEVEARLHRG